jgi:stage II sporulation protein D
VTPIVKGAFTEKPVKRIAEKTILPVVSQIISEDTISRLSPDTVAIITEKKAVVDNALAMVTVQKNSVKVLLAADARSVKIELSGLFTIRTTDGLVEIKPGRYTVSFSGKRVLVSEIGNKFDVPLLFEPLSQDGRFTIGDNSYRGRLLFDINKNSSNIVVNEVLIEDYLKGVLPYEIGKRDSTYFEALKVQALVARTYTYSRLENQRTDGFDVYDDQSDQVYKGIDKEYPLGNAAVDSTKDLVVACRDSLIQSFYFSTSPGKTANVEELWPERGYRTYLRSIDDDEFNKTSPHYQWEERWTKQQLEKILHKTIPILFKGGGKGTLNNIEITENAECGRVKNMRIEMGGRTYDIKGDKVRWILKRQSAPEQILKSAFFSLYVEKRGSHIVSVTAKGGGFGHGIGLSQIGALNMAKSGYSAERIITTYYTDTKIAKVQY